MLPTTIGSILFALAILVLLVLFLVRPFFKVQSQPKSGASRRQQLSTQKAALLDMIRTLDFDYDTGKLPQAEYEQQRAVLMSEAAAVLKELDELPDSPAAEDAVAQIEAAIARIRQQRTESDGKPAQFCTQCGQRLDPGDNFCSSCGQPVYAVQSST